MANGIVGRLYLSILVPVWGIAAIVFMGNIIFAIHDSFVYSRLPLKYRSAIEKLTAIEGVDVDEKIRFAQLSPAEQKAVDDVERVWTSEGRKVRTGSGARPFSMTALI